MELRTLRYFLAAAKEGNITRAAENLHVTQPTLSRQLMELERELDTTLMIRGRKGLMLTGDGVLFRQQAEEIVELADRAKKNFAGKKDAVSGLIVISASQTAGEQLLAGAMRSFCKKFPQVRFQLLYNESEEKLREQMEKGMIDVGLMSKPAGVSGYEWTALPQKERWVLLLHESHPLAGRTEVEYTEAAEYPLILPIKEKLRNRIVGLTGRKEEELNIPLSCARLADAISMVREGLGCTFCLEAEAAVYGTEQLKAIPLIPEQSQQSGLAWKRGRLFSTAASLFIQEIGMRQTADAGKRQG